MQKTTITLAAIIALVFGVVGGAVYTAEQHSSSSPTKVGAGDIVQQYPSYWTNGINIGSRFVTAVPLNLKDKQNQVAWLNNTGQVVMASNFKAIIVPSGKGAKTASSTYIMDVATSTTATITNSAAPIAYPTLIDTYSLATSTTNNIVINSGKNGGTNGQSTIAIAPNQYLILVLENPYNQACTGSVCETATSTNRGFNLSASAEINYANQ